MDLGRSFEDSFSRTEDLLKSIQIYGSMTEIQKEHYNCKEIEEMLLKGHLPRPKVALIDADRPQLDQFFRQKGFKQKGGLYREAYHIPWGVLVAMAKEGDLPLF